MKLIVRMAAAGLFLVGLGGALGQGVGAKRPMTFQDLMAMKRVSDPQISPSGKWVLFSVTDVSLAANTKVNHLWVVPLEADGGNAGSSASLRYDNKKTTAETTTTAGSSAALRNDKQKETDERQVTFGDGEANGRFSPDGKFISISMKDQIYLAPWDEASGTVGEAKALTQVSTGADGAVWSPDSKRLLFVSSVYPECSVKGDAGSSATLRNDKQKEGNDQQEKLIAAMWAEEDACDKAKDEAAEKSPVKAQLFTGLLYRHWNAFTGLKRSHVLVVSAEDGKDVRDLTPASVVGDAETPTFSLGGPLGYAWAPDSKEIAYVTNLDAVKAASTNNDVFTLRLDEEGAKAVKVSTSLGSDDGPAYSPDGRWLAFRSQARAGYESDRFRLMVFDREKKTSRELMPRFDRWVDEFVWSPNSQSLYFASANHGKESVFSFALGGELPIENAPLFDHAVNDGKLNSEFRAEFSELQVTRDGATLLASGMTASSPSSLYRFDLKQHPPEPLHEAGPVVQWQRQNGGDVAAGRIVYLDISPIVHLNDLSMLDLAPIQNFSFVGAEGAKVEGFIVRPPDFDPKKKYPVKLLIHGGPQGAWGDAWSYRWNPELMAASGYVVVMVNPRGSTGYGQAFIDGVNGDWGGKAYVDLMKGLDAAEAQFPFIDKDRECALGASYGGFMANWVLTHTNRFKCIVTHDGMYNPAAAYGDTEEMWFNEWEFRRVGDFGPEGKPAQPWRYAALPADQDPFRKWSPMLHIQDAKTPTLVIHSQKDYRLDVSEGFQLFTALQRLNVPSEMLYFPDEGHWVTKPKNAELWNKTVSDWCDRWTHTNAYAGAK